MKQLIAQNPSFESFNLKINSQEVYDPQYLAFEKTAELFVKYGYFTQQDYLLDVCPEAFHETIVCDEKICRIKAMFVLDDEHYDIEDIKDMMTSFANRMDAENNHPSRYNVDIMA